jgi:glycosyltransferase involved in cell wall biosynthesis
MRLLWVCYSRILEGQSHPSGSERIERLSYLSKLGVHAFLLTGNLEKGRYKSGKNLHIVSVPLKYRPMISPVLYGLVLSFFLPFYVVKIRPDFIISDTATAPFLIWKPFLSKILRFKMVLDVRATPVAQLTSYATRARALFFNLSLWIAKTLFDGMTIVTPMMKKEICSKFSIPLDWAGVLPNGISDDFLRSKRDGDQIQADAYKKELGLSDKFVIIYHGGLSRPNGGLLESIDALGLIKNDYPDVILFLLGSSTPQFLTVLNRKIEVNGVQKNVIQHGGVDFHSVPKFISMSDVGLVPLPNIPVWRYQQPLKLLEYMAMGKTVIAIDSPAHRNAAGERGNIIYVPDANSKAFAAAMMYAYKNRDKLKEWGKVGEQIVEEKYVWKQVNEDLINYLLRT